MLAIAFYVNYDGTALQKQHLLRSVQTSREDIENAIGFEIISVGYLESDSDSWQLSLPLIIAIALSGVMILSVTMGLVVFFGALIWLV